MADGFQISAQEWAELRSDVREGRAEARAAKEAVEKAERGIWHRIDDHETRMRGVETSNTRIKAVLGGLLAALTLAAAWLANHIKLGA